MPLVFQYGSNCDAARLRQRLGALEDLGRAQTRDAYEITFNKRASEGHAAADLLKPRKYERRAWGVLYKISRAAFQTLKAVEGDSYRQQRIAVIDASGVTKLATTFRVRQTKRRSGLWTSAEYVRHIVCGLRAHNVSEEYVKHVIDIALDTNRRAGNAGHDRQIEFLRRRDSCR
jgi:hypothetical protein